MIISRFTANSPHFYSTPNWTQGPSQRGWRGSNRGRGNFTPRGNNRGGNNQSYFHPSMLEDPWADLMPQKMEDESEISLSDSLKPQVGDSLINPAPEVPESLDESNFNATEPSISDSMIPCVGDSILERNLDEN